MWKKILLGLTVFISISASILWVHRIDVLLLLAGSKNKEAVAPSQDVVWQQGPIEKINNNKPNVVLILMDDMGINDVSTFGGGMIPTPNIDQLANQGALFTNGYSGHANCAPSRASLLTGRDATLTGFDVTPIPSGFGRMVAMIENSTIDQSGRPEVEYFADKDKSNPEYNDRGLPSSEVTIAEMMRNAGYHTVHIGKWHLGRTEDMLPNAQGFEESLMMASGLYLPIDHPDVVNGPVKESGLDQFLWASMDFAATFNGSKQFRPKGYITDYYTDEAEKVIEANTNRPFFLYLAHWGPHNPLQATRDDYEAVGDITPHNRRVYAAMLRSLDRSVGRVMTKLEEQGIADNTIVILSSDNGGADYVAIGGLNAPYRGWKNTFFEGGIRVPFSITWPEKIAPGTVIDEPVIHYDLMPTIANAASALVPQDREIHGVDLSPLWNKNTPFARKDNALYWFTGTYRVVQAGDWKLQLNPDTDQIFLHNLANDPTEQTNLAKSEPQKLDYLINLIEQHFEGAVPSAGYSVVSVPITVDKHLGNKMIEGDTYIRWSN